MTSIHRCGCTSYNGDKCYNCLNGAHSLCEGNCDKKVKLAEKFWDNIEKSYPQKEKQTMTKNEYDLDMETLIVASNLPKLTKGILTKWIGEMQKLADDRDGWCHAYSELKEVHESLKDKEAMELYATAKAAQAWEECFKAVESQTSFLGILKPTNPYKQEKP
jgi:hypothetical protein